jgi:hypothetical protein
MDGLIRQGDILIFNDTLGVHERDRYDESNDLFCQRWLKRATPYGQAKKPIVDIEKLELDLPKMIRDDRLKKGLEDPYYAAFLASKHQR